MAEDPKIVVVVPTYNERENLPVLAGMLAELGVPRLQMLVVDDGSPDGTGDVADKLAADTPAAVSVLHRAEKNGLGRAYVAGMTRALDEGADIVIQMDADLSHPAAVVPVMVEALEDPQVGLVIGSRYVPGGSTASQWPWHRKALSAWANFYVNAILQLHVKDATAGFKAWRASALRTVDLVDDAQRRLLLPGGAALPRRAARDQGRRGADPLRGARRRRLQDEPEGAAGVGGHALAPPVRPLLTTRHNSQHARTPGPSGPGVRVCWCL